MKRWCFVRWAGDGSEIFDTDSDELIAKVTDGPDELEYSRLIAAAPDMLAALEWLLVSDEVESPEALSVIRDAVKRAKGEV